MTINPSISVSSKSIDEIQLKELARVPVNGAFDIWIEDIIVYVSCGYNGLYTYE